MEKERMVLYHNMLSEMNDVEKLRFLQGERVFTVMLDNDDAFITIEGDDEGEYIVDFDEFFGWTDGVLNLFKVLDIQAEVV